MNNSLFLEKMIAKGSTTPVDLNAGANTGARIAMKNLNKVTFIAILAAGTTTSSHTFTLKQHDAASSGNTKDLEVSNPYFHKIGAATSFTKVSPTVDAAAYDLHSLLGDSASIVVFEVLAEQLDRTNDYNYVSLNISDAGGTQLGACIAIGDAEYA